MTTNMAYVVLATKYLLFVFAAGMVFTLYTSTSDVSAGTTDGIVLMFDQDKRMTINNCSTDPVNCYWADCTLWGNECSTWNGACFNWTGGYCDAGQPGGSGGDSCGGCEPE